MQRFDAIVIGAGMAGASAAYNLAEAGRVVVLERESQPGYHTTGRSAAIFTETYGNATIRGLTIGGRGFFMSPPAGFTQTPLLRPRGVLFIGRADQAETLARAAEEGRRLVPSVHAISAVDACGLVPVLRADYVAGALLEPDAMDIDVDALHQGFLRGLRARGGEIVTDAAVTALGRAGDDWRVESSAGDFAAPVVVNAAGAWCDVVAGLAGIAPVGLVPKRRTAILFDPPAEMAIEDWPMVIDADEEFYFKPDAGKLMGSPADETPSPPCDAQPEELDIAIAVDRIQSAADLDIRRIDHRWAGLRSFVADKTLVAGFEPAALGFFWLAGQGGYGIQTAPAMGRIVAALIAGGGIPSDLADLGVGEAALSPARFRDGG